MRKGFGIIGLGTWGMTHARGYASHPSARLIAVCDTIRDRADAVVESCPKCTIYTDYGDILADDRIHAVSIATPDHVREQVFCAAAEAGKHILVEKPLAIAVDECERMIDAANASGIKVMVDFHNRWNPPFVQAKHLLTNGELGDLAAASIRLSNTTFVPTEMLGWSAQTTAAWFLGSHCVDLARWRRSTEMKIGEVKDNRHAITTWPGRTSVLSDVASRPCWPRRGVILPGRRRSEEQRGQVSGW